MLNKAAPDFKLADQDGKFHALSDYRGKYVLLYFYPKDMTSGCTVEACNFRDSQAELKKLGVVTLGVSVDDVKSHKKFEEKENLNFPLLADVDKKVVQEYGVWVDMGIQRDSFLINPEGVIIKHYSKVKPETHVDEVLADIAAG